MTPPPDEGRRRPGTGNYIGRRLIGKPVLWQDWDEEEPEKAARYWELFSDLILVAAASSLADGLKERPDIAGLAEMALLYAIIINGWWLYCHHYTARFDDSSLLHSGVLFFFLLGMAGGVVNAGLDTSRGFSFAAVLQRIAFLIMVASVCIFLPRTRAACVSAFCIVGTSTALLLGAAFAPEPVVIGLWIAAAVLEFVLELIFVHALPGTTLVPVNIEHTAERLGVMVLVMLGETALSATITYREFAKEGEMVGLGSYTIPALAFLLIFVLCLLIFNIQPAPKDHALRRSRGVGSALIMLNKVLCFALLCIGACTKLAVHAVMHGEHLTDFAAVLFGRSVGFSFLMLFFMRLCHYGGKLPRPTDPSHVKRLEYIWWSIFAVAGPILLCMPCPRDPPTALTVYTLVLLVLCLVESWFTDVLEPHMPSEESDALHCDRLMPSYQGRYGSVT